MQWWQAALWGLAGGLCVEALELYGQIRRTSKKWSWRRPIPQGLAAYVVSVLIRSGVGAILAAATAADGQVAGPLAALGLGVAAPLVIEKLARAVVAQGVDLQPAAAPPPQAPPAIAPQPAPVPEPPQGTQQGGGVNAL